MRVTRTYITCMLNINVHCAVFHSRLKATMFCTDIERERDRMRWTNVTWWWMPCWTAATVYSLCTLNAVNRHKTDTHKHWLEVEASERRGWMHSSTAAATIDCRTSCTMKLSFRLSLRTVFTALHALHATRSSHEKAVCPSVCPSVCLSNVWFVTKPTKCVPTFLYHIKIIHLSFLTRRMVGGGRPLLSDILGQTDLKLIPLGQKRRISIDIRS